MSLTDHIEFIIRFDLRFAAARYMYIAGVPYPYTQAGDTEQGINSARIFNKKVYKSYLNMIRFD